MTQVSTSITVYILIPNNNTAALLLLIDIYTHKEHIYTNRKSRRIVLNTELKVHDTSSKLRNFFSLLLVLFSYLTCKDFHHLMPLLQQIDQVNNHLLDLEMV